MAKFYVTSVCAVVMFAASASAQPAADGNVVPSASPTALLLRADEGVFQLKQGQAIDLTDRKMLLSFPPDQDKRNMEERKAVVLKVGGIGWSVAAGDRMNLKDGPYSQINTVFKDKDACILDLVDLAVPKGAPATATMRLDCN